MGTAGAGTAEGSSAVAGLLSHQDPKLRPFPGKLILIVGIRQWLELASTMDQDSLVYKKSPPRP